MSQSELYSPLGSGLPEYEYRKTAHTLDGIYTLGIHSIAGRAFFTIPIFGELSRFNGWNSAKRFFNMYVVFAVRRYKDKNNLANNVQCEPYFLQKYFIFFDFSRSGIVFSSFFLLLSCNVLEYLYFYFFRTILLYPSMNCSQYSPKSSSLISSP